MWIVSYLWCYFKMCKISSPNKMTNSKFLLLFNIHSAQASVPEEVS
jgi:hypothetical protein